MGKPFEIKHGLKVGEDVFVVDLIDGTASVSGDKVIVQSELDTQDSTLISKIEAADTTLQNNIDDINSGAARNVVTFDSTVFFDTYANRYIVPDDVDEIWISTDEGQDQYVEIPDSRIKPVKIQHYWVAAALKVYGTYSGEYNGAYVWDATNNKRYFNFDQGNSYAIFTRRPNATTLYVETNTRLDNVIFSGSAGANVTSGEDFGLLPYSYYEGTYDQVVFKEQAITTYELITSSDAQQFPLYADPYNGGSGRLYRVIGNQEYTTPTYQINYIPADLSEFYICGASSFVVTASTSNEDIDGSGPTWTYPGNGKIYRFQWQTGASWYTTEIEPADFFGGDDMLKRTSAYGLTIAPELKEASNTEINDTRPELSLRGIQNQSGRNMLEIKEPKAVSENVVLGMKPSGQLTMTNYANEVAHTLKQTRDQDALSIISPDATAGYNNKLIRTEILDTGAGAYHLYSVLDGTEVFSVSEHGNVTAAQFDTTGTITGSFFYGDGQFMTNGPNPFDQILDTTSSPTFNVGTFTDMTSGSAYITGSIYSGSIFSDGVVQGRESWLIYENSPFTAIKNLKYFINTTAGDSTITMPADVVFGDSVEFCDLYDTWATNNVTILFNGLKYNGDGSTPTFIANVSGSSLKFVYVDTSRGWKRIR